MRCLCSRNDLFLCCVRFSHDNVVTDRSILQPCLLQHHSDAASQTGSRHVTDICSIYGDHALIDIVEAHQKIDHSRLSTAGRSDNRNTLSRFYGKIKILDQLLLRHIGEGYIFQFYRSLYLRKLDRIRAVRFLRLSLHQFKYSGGTGDRILQLCDDAGNLVKRLCVLIGIA